MSKPRQRYSVQWSSPAKRAIERLPEKVAVAAIEFIYGPLAETPQKVGHPLRLEFEGLYSARRGDHRIIYQIDEQQHRVIVHAIGHRADLYRRR
ncbi:MAG: type II toxin-antitoxin system RelE family toxin [Acidimicrobiia bacterium]